MGCDKASYGPHNIGDMKRNTQKVRNSLKFDNCVRKSEVINDHLRKHQGRGFPSACRA